MVIHRDISAVISRGDDASRSSLRIEKGREELLNNLDDLKDSLNALLTAFIVFRDIVAECSRTETKLMDATQSDKNKLYTSYFWEEIEACASGTHDKIVGLEDIIKQDEKFEEMIKKLDTTCQETRNTARQLKIATNKGDVMQAAGEILRSNASVVELASDMMTISRTKTENKLKELGSVITRVRTWFEIAGGSQTESNQTAGSNTRENLGRHKGRSMDAQHGELDVRSLSDESRVDIRG